MNDIEKFKCYKGILGPQLLIQEIFIEHILHLRYCDRIKDRDEQNEDRDEQNCLLSSHSSKSSVGSTKSIQGSKI